LAAHDAGDRPPHAPDPRPDRALVDHRRPQGVRPDLHHDPRRADVFDGGARHDALSPGVRAERDGHRVGDRGDPDGARAGDGPGAGAAPPRWRGGGGGMSARLPVWTGSVRAAAARRVGAPATLAAALAVSLAPAAYMLSMSFMDNPQLF